MNTSSYMCIIFKILHYMDHMQEGRDITPLYISSQTHTYTAVIIPINTNESLLQGHTSKSPGGCLATGEVIDDIVNEV